MATKRMFSNNVIDSDAFLDLPPYAQLLYFHIGMKTDDDGFVTGTKRIMRIIGGTDGDIEALIDSGFLIPFPESRVYAVTHFRINNELKNDRYHPTVFKAEFERLMMTDNREYCLMPPSADPGPGRVASPPEPGMTEEDNVSQESISQESKRKYDNVEPELLICMSRNYGLNTRFVQQAIVRYGCSPVYEAIVDWRADMDRTGKVKPLDYPAYLNDVLERQKNP